MVVLMQEWLWKALLAVTRHIADRHQSCKASPTFHLHLLHTVCSSSGMTLDCGPVAQLAPGAAQNFTVALRTTVHGTVNVTVSLAQTGVADSNDSNHEAANATFLVTRSCQQYNPDASGFVCPDMHVFNPGAAGNTSPSQAVCCVSAVQSCRADMRKRRRIITMHGLHRLIEAHKYV
jgi:hypothetical protein